MKTILTMLLAAAVLHVDAKGNTNTIQSAAWAGDLSRVKNYLAANDELRGWAIGACSTAAVAGNKEALDILLAQDTHGQMNYLLAAPAEANVGPAVDYFIAWMNSDQPFQNGVGDVMTATNAVASAAAKGNLKAKEALEKFAARFPKKTN